MLSVALYTSAVKLPASALRWGHGDSSGDTVQAIGKKISAHAKGATGSIKEMRGEGWPWDPQPEGCFVDVPGF